MSDDGEIAPTDGEPGGETSQSVEMGETSTGPSRKRRAVSILQWVLALGAFWYVARDVDWAAIGTDLATVSVTVVLAILGITVLEFGSRFSMWYVLINGRVDASLATTARVDLVIKFVNHVIPSKASGHSIAPLVLRHYTEAEWSEAVSIAGLNTGLYAALYGLTALSGIVYFAGVTGRLAGGWVVVILLSTSVYLAAGGLVLLAGRRLDVAGRLVGRLESLAIRVPRIGQRLASVASAIPSFTDDSAGVFRHLSGNPRVVVPYALAWAGTLMVSPALRVWLLLTALGGSFSPALLLPVVLVTAYSVTVLPLTPGGVGIAEASATAVLVSLGVGPEHAAVVVLVDRTLGVYIPAMLGWIPMARLDLSALVTTDG